MNFKKVMLVLVPTTGGPVKYALGVMDDARELHTTSGKHCTQLTPCVWIGGSKSHHAEAVYLTQVVVQIRCHVDAIALGPVAMRAPAAYSGKVLSSALTHMHSLSEPLSYHPHAY